MTAPLLFVQCTLRLILSDLLLGGEKPFSSVVLACTTARVILTGRIGDDRSTIPLMDSAPASRGSANFGLAWLLLSLALCAHVADESLTGFLAVYNPTVVAVRANYPWFPMPTFEFRGWLTGLIAACVILLLLTPLAYRNARWLRPLAYFFAFIMLLNGLGHTVATILGRTVASVQFPRPAPGFYSSPFLLAGVVFLFIRLRASAKQSPASA